MQTQVTTVPSRLYFGPLHSFKTSFSRMLSTSKWGPPGLFEGLLGGTTVAPSGIGYGRKYLLEKAGASLPPFIGWSPGASVTSS